MRHERHTSRGGADDTEPDLIRLAAAVRLVRVRDGERLPREHPGHTDHLGRAADGSVVHEQWFGPFGRRLDPQGRDLPRNAGVPDGLRVGFTGHE